MKVRNIQDLSDYVLIDIFKNLCERDIPQIREVCSRWAYLVSNYTYLRRKYSLFVSHCILDEDNEFVQTFLTSPFTIPTTVTFHYVVFQKSYLLSKLWKKIGKSLESLHFILGDINFPVIKRAAYGHNWILLLKETSNLTELGLILDSWTSQTFEPISPNENCQLGKLKKITLSCCNPFLNIFLLNMLLKFAKRLESIDYTGNKGSTMEADSLCRLIESRTSTLKHMKLQRVKDEHLIRYLRTKNLSLVFLHVMCDSVYEDLLQIITNLLSLRVLVFVADEICHDATRDVTVSVNEYICNEVNLQLHTFQVSGQFKVIPMDSLQCFFDNYLNLRILRLGDFECEARIVIKIIQKLSYLEEMEIKVNAKDPAFDKDTFKDISNMKNLMTLSILDYCQLCDDSFLTHHLHVPTLKKLWLDTDTGKNSKITNFGVLALYRNCPLLDQLVLINFDGITNAVLDQIPVLLLHLSEVVIQGKNITNKKLIETRSCLENRL